jgi:hypothetical protein
MPKSVKVLFSALEEIRTPNLLIRSNHAYCDVLNEICAVQPTGRANRTRNSQMLSVRRPRALYGATYGARSITAWLIAGSQRSVVRPVIHHAAQSLWCSNQLASMPGCRRPSKTAQRRPAGTSAKRPRSVVASRDLTRASWAQITEYELEPSLASASHDAPDPPDMWLSSAYAGGCAGRVSNRPRTLWQGIRRPAIRPPIACGMDPRR